MADWQRIEAAYRQGDCPVRELARQEGISEGAVRKRAKAQGWPVRTRRTQFRDQYARAREGAHPVIENKGPERSPVRTTGARPSIDELEAQVQIEAEKERMGDDTSDLGEQYRRDLREELNQPEPLYRFEEEREPPADPEPDPPICLVAHHDATFPGSFKVFTTSDAWLIAVGRAPLEASLLRLREEGMLAPGGRVKMVFVDGREPLEHVEPGLRRRVIPS